MKKFMGFGLAVFVLFAPLSACFADYHGEDHLCFMQVDMDQDGRVTFQEFEKAYGNDPEKFQAMDQDHDGQLTHDEYEEYVYNQEGSVAKNY
ncbi:MAG: EF-hand domain-containing protein [Desulfobacter sp.]|nr:EF-hand domain-containing protein [Desulfobacter sp.]